MKAVDKLPGSKAVLGLFAKEPRAGQVKTRLSPPLTCEQAAELSRRALGETVERMAGGGFDLVLCYAGNRDYFSRNFPGIRLLEQTGLDLGARMSNALQDFFRQGYRRAVLIGSDSPDLPLETVEQAFFSLYEAQLVLAPALDGGYVLIGESRHHEQLFEEMPWSSPDLLALTTRRAEREGIDYRLLRCWDDLDDLEAVRRFLHRSPDSQTAEYLRGLPSVRGALT